MILKVPQIIQESGLPDFPFLLYGNMNGSTLHFINDSQQSLTTNYYFRLNSLIGFKLPIIITIKIIGSLENVKLLDLP